MPKDEKGEAMRQQLHKAQRGNHQLCITGVILASTMLTGLMPSDAAAQNTAPAQSGTSISMIEDIVVTARRREERLQDVPISVSALSMGQLQHRGIQDIQDVGSFVPNVKLTDAGRVNDTRVFIRGVGGGDSNASGQQSGVGIYIDGIYMPRSLGGYFSTLDVERIEVLRGPQGTLFGKNTTGGAVNVITRKPGPETEGELTLRVGNYDQFDIRASANLPIIEDRLFARLSAGYERRDGFYKELNTGDTYDNNQVRAMRLAVRWLATDNLTIDVSGDYVHEPERSLAGTCMWNFRGAFQARLEAEQGINFQEICNGDPKEREFRSDVAGFSNTKIWGVNGTATWNAPNPVLFFEDAQVKLITAWRGQTQSFLQDSEFTEAGLEARGRTPVEQEQRAVEIQFNGSALDGRMQLVSGLYWSDDIAREGGNDCRDELAGLDLAAGDEALCHQPNGFMFIGPVSGTAMAQINSDIETKAVYANASFDITNRLSLTAGIRHTWEDRSFHRLDIANVQFSGASRTAILNAQNVGINEGGDESWKAWTPLASLRFAVPEFGPVTEADIYFTWARGFQSGGFNTDFPRSFLGEDFIYDPEKVDSYEVGLKSRLFGGTTLLNIAGFISDYKDRQEVVQVENEGRFPTLDPSLALIENAATAKIKGIELELYARPTDQLGINLTVGYIHARYGSFVTFDPNLGQDVDISNRRLENFTPDWQITGTVDYRFDLAGGSSLTPMVIGYYRSGYEFQRNTMHGDPHSAIYQKAHTKWDARLSWMNADENVRISLWGKNVFDKDTLRSGSVIQGGARGYSIIYLEQPRTFGIEGQFRF